jgi:hypothetical protein
MSVRRFGVLVEHLGQRRDSALTHGRLGPAAEWGYPEELAKLQAELQDLTNRLLHKAFFKGPKPKPLEIKRPTRPGEKALPKPKGPSAIQTLTSIFGPRRRRKRED